MFNFDIDKIINNLYTAIMWNVELYLPKFIWALIILAFWVIIAMAIHKFVKYLFKKFNILDIIDRITLKFDEEHDKDKKESEKTVKKKLSQKVKIDEITAKSISYYIFLVFFRLAIIVIWIKEVEQFLWDLLAYLPSLFIWVIIWFFGIRFANFVYDVVYHTLSLTRQKTSRIIASGAKIIILFFTLMLVLNYTKIVDTFIINTILVWFISMLTIAWGLAFWLGWKEIAHEILESFRK